MANLKKIGVHLRLLVEQDHQRYQIN